MNAFRYIVLLSRPRFWIYTLGPFLIGIAASVSSIQSTFSIFLAPFALISYFYFGLVFNVLIYSVNDWFDRESDLHSTKKKGKEITPHPQYLKHIILISLVISLAYSLILKDLQAQIVFFLMLLLANFYSAPPLRFKTKVFLDSISNGFYILPAVIGYMVINGVMPNIYAVAAGWVWCMGMHLFSAIPDIGADSNAKLTTTAVKLGKTNSLLLTSLYWLLTAVFGFAMHPLIGILGLIYVCIPLNVWSLQSNEKKVYWYFPKINFVSGFILFLFALYI